MYIASFYRFKKIEELEYVRECVEQLCTESRALGTFVVAREGINAALAQANATVLESLVDQIRHFLALPELVSTISRARTDSLPFDKLLVRIRSETVTYGSSFDFTFPTLPKASPTEWTDLILDDDTVVLDVRNRYEHRLGRFRNSIQPSTNNFREFKDYLNQQTEIDKDQNVAIYCTGGIRCEKAAQSMFKHGFKSIVQLDRGILGYLQETKNSSVWEGECFVFDQRVAVDETLAEGTAEFCLACGDPITPEEKSSPLFEYGISCSTCRDALTPADRARRAERVRQLNLARLRAA